MINCVNNPCKDCTKREIGCHDRCDDYKAFKDEMNRIKDNIHKAHEHDKYFNRAIAIAKKKGASR